MRHRMVSGTGLGNPDPAKLDNKGRKPPKKVADLAIASFFSDTLGCDFQWRDDALSLGIEPAYQGDRLCVVTVHRDKTKSTWTEGHAFGYYGSGIRSKTRTYSEYKYRSKFVKFVDQAHQILWESK